MVTDAEFEAAKEAYNKVIDPYGPAAYVTPHQRDKALRAALDAAKQANPMPVYASKPAG
jgi:hypothetical protein